MRRLTSKQIRENEGRELARPGLPSVGTPCPECGGRMVIELVDGSPLRMDIWFHDSEVDCGHCLALYHLCAEILDEQFDPGRGKGGRRRRSGG